MSLIPNFAVEEKKTSFGTVDPQDVVAALGKSKEWEATYSDSSSSPFADIRLPINGCRWEGSS